MMEQNEYFNLILYVDKLSLLYRLSDLNFGVPIYLI